MLEMLILAGLFSLMVGVLLFSLASKGQKTVSVKEPMNDEEKRKLKLIGVSFAIIGLILIVAYGVYKIPFSFVLYVG